MENDLTQSCPLCYSTGEVLSNKIFFLCHACKGIFRSKQFFLDSAEEKSRYEKHNNDVHDKKYQQFVAPITEAVLSEYNSTHTGLDFGAGTGSAISKVLKDLEYAIELYDPFFHNHPDLLKKNTTISYAVK